MKPKTTRRNSNQPTVTQHALNRRPARIVARMIGAAFNLIACSLILVAISQTAFGTTYAFLSNLGGNVSYGTFSGTITTDGTLGSLTSSNLVSMELYATNPPNTDLDVLVTPYISGDLEATPTGLFVFAPPPANEEETLTGLNLLIHDERTVQDNLEFEFISGYDASDQTVSFAHYVTFSQQPGLGYIPYYSASEAADGVNWEIATVVPEPSSLALSVFSVISLAIAAYRRAGKIKGAA